MVYSDSEIVCGSWYTSSDFELSLYLGFGDIWGKCTNWLVCSGVKYLHIMVEAVNAWVMLGYRWWLLLTWMLGVVLVSPFTVSLPTVTSE
jgi:hypothetical protein